MDDPTSRQDHVFLGHRQAEAERNVRIVIALTLAMMALEILGGAWFGSIALIADGFHMSTHAGALMIAAAAYAFARRHARDERFTFGAGKFGDLAAFSSALILGVIALNIGWEAAGRLLAPKPIAFAQAIPIAALGLCVNIASAWLLARGGHRHHGAAHDHDDRQTLVIAGRAIELGIFEDGVAARFRLKGAPRDAPASVETLRPDGSRQIFALHAKDDYLESIDEIPEPHAFEALVSVGDARAGARFAERAPDRLHRDHNLRAAIVHVIADAAVSVLVIVGLTLAYLYGWLFLDPLAALVGALVIASWSYQLIRDAGAVLLDVNPDAELTARLRRAVEREGDALLDLHLWRLGPGHLGAIVSIETASGGDCAEYRRKLGALARFSHLTVEVLRGPAAPARRSGA